MSNLPAELWGLIFSELTPSYPPYGRSPKDFDYVGMLEEQVADEALKLQTLFNVSLASKTFNRIAAPFFYHTINLRYGQAGRLPHFLALVIDRPDIASMVRAVSAPHWTWPQFVFMYDDMEMSKEKLVIAAKAAPLLESVKSTLVRVFTAYPRTDGRQLKVAQLMLLITLCRNIQKVEVPRSKTTGWPTFEKLVAGAARTSSEPDPPWYPNVNEFRVSSGFNTTEVELWDGWCWIPIMQIPALTTFHGFNLRFTGLSASFTSNLRRIYLRHTTFDSLGFSSLLQACPKLRSFSFDSDMPSSLSSPFRAYGNALRKHGTGLNSLVISNWSKGRSQRDYDYTVTPLGDLRPLTSLRNLCVPFVALDSIDNPRRGNLVGAVNTILPRSLESLCMYRVVWSNDSTESDYDILQDLLTDRTLTNLRSLEYRDSQVTSRSELTKQSPQALCDIAEKLGWNNAGSMFTTFDKRGATLHRNSDQCLIFRRTTSLIPSG